MKLRIPYLVTIFVFIVLFILGSFFDYNLSNSIASSTNIFALSVSVIGVLPCYFVVSIMAGAWLSYTIDKNNKLWLRILGAILCLVNLAISFFYSGREFFGVNGFDNSKYIWLGYLFVAPLWIGCCWFGTYLVKKLEIKHLWFKLLIITLALIVAILIGINVIKGIVQRPRFRFVSREGIDFYPWYKICDPNTYSTLSTFAKEEFKSFPSGHMSSACVLPAVCLLFPLISDKLTKWQLPFFIGSMAYALLVGFARILAGAHYLSDVSMGALITFAFMGIAYLILKKFEAKNNEQAN